MMTRTVTVMRVAGVEIPQEHDEAHLCAAMEFEPLQHGHEKPITIYGLHQAADLGSFQAATLAYHVLFRTKQQLVSAALSEDGFRTIEALHRSFDEAREWLDAISGMIKTAEVRLLVAMSAAALVTEPNT